MNKKGFTLIELITTFALSTVIIILLINIVLIIKNIYSENNIKSELILEQSNLSNLMNQKFDIEALESYTPCDETNFCYDFYFVDGSIDRLVVDDKSIRYGSYVHKLGDGTAVEDPTLKIFNIKVASDDVNDSILVINIPIIKKLYPSQDFGINIVYQYNSKEMTL